MTNAELATVCGAVITGLGGVAGTIRWAVTRITTAIESNSAVMLRFVESAARLEVKLDHVTNATSHIRDFVTDERTGNFDIPRTITPQRVTPPKGIREVSRPGTRNGDR